MTSVRTCRRRRRQGPTRSAHITYWKSHCSPEAFHQLARSPTPAMPHPARRFLTPYSLVKNIFFMLNPPSNRTKGEESILLKLLGDAQEASRKYWERFQEMAGKIRYRDGLCFVADLSASASSLNEPARLSSWVPLLRISLATDRICPS